MRVMSDHSFAIMRDALAFAVEQNEEYVRLQRIAGFKTPAVDEAILRQKEVLENYPR